MSYWPQDMTTDPIGEWPGIRTARPTRSPFSAKIGTTVAELRLEMRAIGATDVRLQIDLPAHKFRLDGTPRADAVPSSPGLILTFTTKVGAQSYPCDSYTRWEDNLRAIVLTLNALRAVSRYGVSNHGEQYRGFLAIEGATAMPVGFATAAAAREYLSKIAGFDGVQMLDSTLIRAAKRYAHPDTGGDAETFQRVTLAEQTITATEGAHP